MQLLSQITIPRPGDDAHIQLLLGDLTNIPKEHAADILVISAYPGSYIPVPKTLMAALYNKGVLVGKLAEDKEINLIDQLGCWLSKPLSPSQQEEFNIKRILCFEPGSQTNEQDKIVGNIFRCINTFAFENDYNTIAMPLLASGNQKVPVQKMLPAILDAAIFWFENGLPLKCIKLALYGEQQVLDALPIFINRKQDYDLNASVKDHFAAVAESINKEKSRQPSETILLNKENNTSGSEPVRTQDFPLQESNQLTYSVKNNIKETTSRQETAEYDLFISYAHTQTQLIDSFVRNSMQKNAGLNIFYDKDLIPSGGIWLKHISDAIQKSKRVIVFLSPDYTNSPVCWDEFQCAKLIEYKRKTQVIQTIYLHDYGELEMPPIMGIYNWFDCREGDPERLIEFIEKILPDFQ